VNENRPSWLTVESSAPRDWDEMCKQRHSLFAHSDWQELLHQSFGTGTLYISFPQLRSVATVTVFRAGPFSIGYWGFPLPVSTTESCAPIQSGLPEELRRTLSDMQLTHLRLTVGAFAPPCPLPFQHQHLPETAIRDLKTWRQDDLGSSTRRNIKTAQRLLRIVEADNGEQAKTMHQLYRETVRRHSGTLRYSAEYFHRLVALGSRNPVLRCVLAIHEQQIAGFVVVALEGRTAYYLHGATRAALQHCRPSDLLFHESIQWARDRGMQEFNFMASPREQVSLVRYKEKWGGTTRDQSVYEIPIRPIGSSLFLHLADLQRRLRRYSAIFRK